MTQQVRIGLVGTSWWSEMTFLPALSTHPGARLAAICGRDEGRASAVAAMYGIDHVFTDYRDLIASDMVDALIVAAPDDLHYAITMAALDARLHVLCEKPLALSARDARQMCMRAEAAGCVHMVNFTWRMVPHLQHMRQLVADGYIGRCLRAELRFLGSYGRSGAYAWRFDQRRANGVLGDLGSHLIDLAHWIVGDITCVSAELGTLVERRHSDGAAVAPANDTAALLVTFASGMQGVIVASAVDHRAEIEVVLQGARGRLEAGVPIGPGFLYLRGRRDDETAMTPLPVPEQLWRGVVRNASTSDFDALVTLVRGGPNGARQFVDAILAGLPASPNFRDGLRVQEVIDHALDAYRTGRRIVCGPPAREQDF